MILSALVLLAVGIALRCWVFEQTRPIRFLEDMDRGYRWGEIARNRGVLGLYDMMRNQPPFARFWLDYAPLRLMTMWGWASINSVRYEQVSRYENTLDFALPMIALNTLADVASAVAVFVLVRRFASPTRAMIAAGCLFLNPAVLIGGYAWMTWDGWLIPFFLWSLYFALRDRWWMSGLLLAVGALFKGQIAFAAILFIVWPLVQGRWVDILRWAAGFVFAAGVGVSPWMLRNIDGSMNQGSVVWMSCVTLTIAVFAIIAIWRRWRLGKWLWICSALFGASFLLCMTITGASDAWFICGYEFGTRHFNRLAVGLPNNIPAVLDKTFDFGSDTDVYYPILTLAGYTLTLKPAMQILTLVLTLITTIATAMLHKRNDSRVLIAAVLPWLFAYLFPLQIHERYLLYFAASSMCLLGAGVLPMVMGWLASIVAALSTLAVLLKPERLFAHEMDAPDSPFVIHGQSIRDVALLFHPHAAWFLLAMAIAMLTIVWLPRAKEQRSVGAEIQA